MNPAAEAIMQNAIARLEQTGAAQLARREAQKRDPRSLALTAVIEALAPAPAGHGFAGGLQTFETLGSARHWRHMRAKALLTARKQQINGDPNSAWFWLRKAAEHRKSEKLWGARERSPFHAVLMSAATPQYERQAAE